MSSCPWATIDFDFMNLNQAAHGDREYAYIESRLGVPRTTVVGHASHRRVQEQVGEWARAAAGVLASRNMRVARFGDNMRFVAVTEGDKTEAEAVFGAQINTWGVMDLAARVDAATDSQVDVLIEEYADSYDVAPELMPGGVRYQSLRDGAAIEVGLRSFLEEGALPRLHHDVRGPGHARASCPGSRCSASWLTATGSVPRVTGRLRCSFGWRQSWAPGDPAVRA